MAVNTAVNTYVPIFQGLDAHGGKLQTDTHTHKQDNYSMSRRSTVTLAHAR